jgi:HEAT repeat protein
MAMALVLAIAGGWPAGAGEPAQPDGEEARKTEALIKQLADPAAEERQKAAEALGKLGLKAKPAVSALIVAIGDEEKDVRSAAFDALIAIGPRAASDLIKALRDPDENRRKNAQAVLFNYNGNIPHVVSELIAMLDDKSPWVRKICAELLGSVGYRAQDARPKLAAMLDDPECMPSAAWALQQVGAPEDAAPRLLQLLKHEDPSVRVSASGALSMMAHRRMGIAKMTACVDDFVRLTEDQKWQTRGNAALALGDIGPVNDKVIPALVKRLDDEVGRVQVQPPPPFGVPERRPFLS